MNNKNDCDSLDMTKEVLTIIKKWKLQMQYDALELPLNKKEVKNLMNNIEACIEKYDVKN